MAKVIITIEDMGNTLNYAAIAMMTINANARIRGDEVQDVPELKQ